MKELMRILVILLSVMFVIQSMIIGASSYPYKETAKINNKPSEEYLPKALSEMPIRIRGKRSSICSGNDNIIRYFDPFFHEATELRSIYENDECCSLMESQYAKSKNLESQQSDLRNQYKTIVADLEKYARHIIDMQDKNIQGPYPNIIVFLNATRSNQSMNYVDYFKYMQKETLNLGYIRKCSHDKNINFCKDAKAFYFDIEAVFLIIDNILKSAGHDSDLYLTAEFRNSLINLQNEPYQIVCECEDIETQINNDEMVGKDASFAQNAGTNTGVLKTEKNPSAD